MDVRYISSAGYQLWVCEATSGEVVSVPVCDPTMISSNVGDINLQVAANVVSPQPKHLKPSMRAFPDPTSL